MRITNLTRGKLLAVHARLATTFHSRLRGWMGKPRAERGEALVIYPCRSVHTCFMSFPIDILFVSTSGRIVYILERLSPWRWSRVVREACLVIELPPGTVAECGGQVGDAVEIEGWDIPRR